MAVKSGSFQSMNNSDRVNEGWGIRVDWQQLDNSYKVHAVVYLEKRMYWANLNINNDRSGTLTINGTNFNLFLDGPNSWPPRVEDIYLGEGTVDVGSAKTITISAEFNMQWTLRDENVEVFSASRNITLDSIMEPPNAPHNLSFTRSDKTLNASWSHTTSSLRPRKDFEYQWETNGSWGSSKFTTSTSASMTGARGSTYRFSVRARNDAGNSGWTTSGSVTIPYLVPNIPSLSGTISETTAKLSWTVTTDSEKPIDSFRIERSANGGQSWSNPSNPSSGSRNYDNTGLTRGTTYLYRIRAQGPGGNSGWSNTVSLRPPYLPPNKPTNLTVTRTAYNNFRLEWGQTTSSDRPVSQYDIYRRSRNGTQSSGWSGWTKIATINYNSNSLQYNDSSVDLGMTYQYYIVAKNVDESTQSDNSNVLTNPSGIPVYNGSQYHIHPVYVYDGTNWVHRAVFTHNGTDWHWRA